MQRGFVNWSNTQGVSLKNEIHNYLYMDSKRAYEEAEKELEENIENDVKRSLSYVEIQQVHLKARVFC